MTFLKYDEALIWLDSNVIPGIARQHDVEYVEDMIEERGVWFEQDAVHALRDFVAGKPGANDPGNKNNSCLDRRSIR